MFLPVGMIWGFAMISPPSLIGMYLPSNPSSIAFISAGLHIPTEEIQAIYEKYERRVAQVEVSKDEFFDKNFDFKDGGMFDLGQKKQKVSKADFFADVEKESKGNKKVKPDITSSY